MNDRAEIYAWAQVTAEIILILHQHIAMKNRSLSFLTARTAGR